VDLSELMAFPTEIVIVLLIVLAIVAVGYLSTLRIGGAKFTVVKIGDTAVNAEIADTALKKMKGLMFRSSLGEIDGMLFLFDTEGYYGFWMMNTSIPLDIIWVNSTKHVVYIQENAQPCKLTSCPTYAPNAPAMYVLEVNAGFADKHSIKVGSKVEFEIK